MVQYVCEKCGSIFNRKSTFTDHQNRKNKCDENKQINFIFEKSMLNENDRNNNKIDTVTIKKCLEENTCAYCKKYFTRKYSVIQHMNNNCKELKKINIYA